MNAVIPTWFESTARKIGQHLSNINSEAKSLGEQYVSAIDKEPSFASYISDKCPSVPSSFWRSLEKIGRGQMDDRLLCGAIPFGNKVRNLSVSDQAKVISGQMELLVRDGETLLVRIDTITPDQAEQLFARDHVRSLEEQRTFLESKSTRLRLLANPTAPDVQLDKKRQRIVIGNISITASQMADYLRRLTE